VGALRFVAETTVSPPRPFVKAPAKAKLASSVEAQPCVDLTTLPALCVIHVPIIAPRNEDMRRERVMFGFHCRKLSLNITDRCSESFECVLNACPALCSIEHNSYRGQT